jgi:hypothetical protein
MERSSWLALLIILVAVVGGVLAASCLPDPHDLVGRPCDAEHVCGEAALVCCQGTCQPVATVAACEGASPPDGGDGGSGGSPDAGDGGGGGAPDGGTDGGGGSPPDAGSPDAGSPDAGSPDAGAPDAGAPCPPDLLLYGGFEQSTDLGHFGRNGSSIYARTTAVARTGQYGVQITHDPADSDDFYGIALDDNVLTSLTVGTRYCVSAWLKRGTVRGEMRLLTRQYSDSGARDIATIRMTPVDDEWFLILNDQAYLASPYTRAVGFRTSVTPSAGNEYYVDDMRFWESEGGVCDPRCAR